MSGINQEALHQAIEDVRDGRFTKRLTLYASKATIPIRYADITSPQFSMAGAAAGLIEEQMEVDYPELYEGTTKEFKKPHHSRSTHTIKKMDTSNIDPYMMKQAKKEAKSQSGKILAIYNERVATIIRYFMLTTPRYSISKELATLLEKRISNIHPGIWDKFGV